MTLERATLNKLARGLAPALFARELERGLENIADSRTAAQAVRKITIELSFKPDGIRREIVVGVEATSKLAKAQGVRGLMFATLTDNGIAATNSDPTQLTLMDELAAVQAKKELSHG